MSIAVASGLSARYGILVKNGEVLETLSSITHFVFDKTGTLTEGRMTVTSITTAQHQWLHGNQITEEISPLLKDLIALERFSEHPVATAIISCGEMLGLDCRHLEVVNFHNRPGFGVSAEVAGRKLVAGNSAWLDELGVKRQPQLEQEAGRLDDHASALYVVR